MNASTHAELKELVQRGVPDVVPSVQHTEAQRIALLKAGWMLVGKAFQDASKHCEDCSYCNTKGQMLPYGDGQAHEAISECTLGQRIRDSYTQCPAWQASQLTEEIE